MAMALLSSIAVLAFAAVLPSAQATDSCAALFGVKKMTAFSAIFNADDGTFSGTPESHYFVSNMNSIISVPKNKSVCGEIIKGKLLGQDVAIVLTGIGPTAAGFCTLDFVGKCGKYIKEIIYSGTSGWSPQVGGTFPNPPKCATANPNKNITRLGDICVSPLSVNWNCKQASWTMQASAYPNQCFAPAETFGPSAGFLYGQCFFYEDNTVANLEFTMEVIKGMSIGAKNFPKRSSNVSFWETEYWNITSNSTGFTYPYKSTDPVTVYGFDTCAEIDSQFFFSGTPWDYTARDYVAQLLTKAFNSTFNAKDVIAVSAMEAIGVAEAMEKYHKLATTKRKIPYTFVRGNSDWLNKPVYKSTTPGVWGPEDTDFDFPFSIGYAYAIATYSAGIMSFYQARCNALVAAGTLPKSTSCSFTVAYP